MPPNPHLTVSLGALIRAAREEAGLDRAAAAQDAGITPDYLASIEQGRAVPALSTVSRLGSALHLSPEVLTALHAQAETRRAAHPWRGPGRMLGYRPRPA